MDIFNIDPSDIDFDLLRYDEQFSDFNCVSDENDFSFENEICDVKNHKQLIGEILIDLNQNFPIINELYKEMSEPIIDSVMKDVDGDHFDFTAIESNCGDNQSQEQVVNICEDHVSETSTHLEAVDHNLPQASSSSSAIGFAVEENQMEIDNCICHLYDCMRAIGNLDVPTPQEVPGEIGGQDLPPNLPSQTSPDKNMTDIERQKDTETSIVFQPSSAAFTLMICDELVQNYKSIYGFSDWNQIWPTINCLLIGSQVLMKMLCHEI